MSGDDQPQVERLTGFKLPDADSFLSAVRRNKVSISHPTSKQFSIQRWIELRADWGSDPDFERLFQAVDWFGRQLASLRKTFEPIYNGFSKVEAIKASVAYANLSYVLRSEEVDKFHHKISKKAKMFSPSVANIPYYSEQTKQNIDMDSFTTTIVDSLPHALWHAVSRDNNIHTLTESEAARQKYIAFYFGNIESVYRYMWQQILWEGYRIDVNGNAVRFLPPNDRYAAIWPVWDQHRQMITMGKFTELGFGPFADQKLIDASELGPKKVVCAANWDSGRWRLKTTRSVSIPSVERRLVASLLSIMISGLADFVEEKVSSEHDVTFRDLIKCWIVLDTIQSEFAIRTRKIKKIESDSENTFGILLQKNELIETFEECLDFDTHDATFCVDFLTVDLRDTIRLFNKGVWDQPIIPLDDNRLLLCGPPVDIGNIARTFQHWLVRALGNKSGELKGSGFEGQLCDGLTERLAETALRVTGTVHGPALSFLGEEIDCILVLDNHVYVIEAKCLATPGDPAERFNFLRQLHDGCQQAKRKSEIVRENLAAFCTQISIHSAKDASPLVVVPDSYGAGLEFDGVPVVEAGQLKMLITDDHINVAKAKKGDTSLLKNIQLYAGKAFDPDRFAWLLRNPYQITQFLKQVRFSFEPFPSGMEEVEFFMHFPTLVQQPDPDVVESLSRI